MLFLNDKLENMPTASDIKKGQRQIIIIILTTICFHWLSFNPEYHLVALDFFVQFQ